MAKTPTTSSKATSRPQRLAEALRANLKRRKAQARSRAGAGKSAPESKER